MFMHRIKLKNILSFGPEEQDLELKPLNVLIGPNGAGKSNLIEVIGLLRAAPTDIMAPIREGGGGGNWLWRGDPSASAAHVEVVMGTPYARSDKEPIRYSLSFGSFIFGIPGFNEEIGEVERTVEGEEKAERFLERRGGKVTLTYRSESGERAQRELPATNIRPGESILSQLKDPVQYSELTDLGIGLGSIHLYREWSFGRNHAAGDCRKEPTSPITHWQKTAGIWA